MVRREQRTTTTTTTTTTNKQLQQQSSDDKQHLTHKQIQGNDTKKVGDAETNKCSKRQEQINNEETNK